MSLPASLLLMQLRSQPPENKNAVSEVIEILDQFTFNDEEARILEIIKAMTPQEVANFVNVLSQSTEVQSEYVRMHLKHREVSYLEKLYQDMHGEEFAAMCLLIKSNLLLLKAGSSDRFVELLTDAINKERPAEIPKLKLFDPSELTSPSTWGARQYPAACDFTNEGKLVTKWMSHTGFLDTQGSLQDEFIMEPTDLITIEDATKKGLVDIACVFDLKFLADQHYRNAVFTQANIIGVLLGAGLVSAAKGLAKKALIAFVQVIFPSTSQFVTEHQDEILALNHGPRFVQIFNGLNMLIAAFSIYQIFSPAGRSLWNAFKSTRDDILSDNPVDNIVNELKNQVDRLDDGLMKIEKQVIDKDLIPPKASSGSSGSASSGNNPGGGPNGSGPGTAPPSQPPGGSGSPPGGAPPGGSATPPSGSPTNVIFARQPIDPSVPKIPITNGEIIATGKDELEMFFELQRNAHQSRIQLFSNEDASKFYLVKRTSANDIPFFSALGHVGWGYILTMTEDFVSAENQLIGLARRYTQTKVELGLYRKVLPDGTERFAVIEGFVDRVTGGPGWKPVSHTHYDAEIHQIFHHPAPTDFASAITASINEKNWIETIISFDKNGYVVRVPYGYNLNKKQFFVKLPSGQTRYFDLVDHPNHLNLEMKKLEKTTDTLEKIRNFKELFITNNLDPDSSYTVFWAMMYGS